MSVSWQCSELNSTVFGGAYEASKLNAILLLSDAVGLLHQRVPFSRVVIAEGEHPVDWAQACTKCNTISTDGVGEKVQGVCAASTLYDASEVLAQT